MASPEERIGVNEAKIEILEESDERQWQAIEKNIQKANWEEKC